MAESTSETIRLPESLVQLIDTNFVNSGLFSSRADFVSSAVRYYYENSIYLFSRYAEIASYILKDNPKVKKIYPTAVSLVKGMIQNSYRLYHISDYEGNKISILLRLPPTFVKLYTQYINESCLYKNKADFFNKAIEYYLEAQFFAKEIHQAIHHRDGNTITSYRDKQTFINMWSPMVESKLCDEFEDVDTRDSEKETWLDDIKPSERFLKTYNPDDYKQI